MTTITQEGDTPELTHEDLTLVLSGLDVLRRKIEETQYPTYALRRERLEECERTMSRVRAIRNQTPREKK